MCSIWLVWAEDTDATNELIADDRTAQTLTMSEISAMKAAGVSAQEIIAKQIERHTAFHLKNAYSKDKYKKRKEQKCVFLPPPPFLKSEDNPS